MKKEEVDQAIRSTIIFVILLILYIVLLYLNFHYLLSNLSKISLLISFIIVVEINKWLDGERSLFGFFKSIFKMSDISDIFFYILLIFLTSLIIWQPLLFLLVIGNAYLVPVFFSIISRDIGPKIYFAIKLLSDSFDSNLFSGFLGAVIGGIFSIIAVRITVKSANKENINKSIEIASPKIVVSTVNENADRIIGSAALVSSNYSDDYSVDCKDTKTYKSKSNSTNTFYITNIGGEALNIKIDMWFWDSFNKNSILFNTRGRSPSIFVLLWHSKTKDKPIREFPMLKKGDAFEVIVAHKKIQREMRLDIYYTDVFSNYYTQYHSISFESYVRVSALPQYLFRNRRKKINWKPLKLFNFYNKYIPEEVDRYKK